MFPDFSYATHDAGFMKAFPGGESMKSFWLASNEYMVNVLLDVRVADFVADNQFLLFKKVSDGSHNHA